jgi:hypothetical protein
MQQKGVRQLRPGTTTVLISCGRISKFQNDMRQFFSGQRALLLSRPLPQMPLPLSQQLRMGLRDKRFAQVFFFLKVMRKLEECDNWSWPSV